MPVNTEFHLTIRLPIPERSCLQIRPARWPKTVHITPPPVERFATGVCAIRGNSASILKRVICTSRMSDRMLGKRSISSPPGKPVAGTSVGTTTREHTATHQPHRVATKLGRFQSLITTTTKATARSRASVFTVVTPLPPSTASTSTQTSAQARSTDSSAIKMVPGSRQHC